MSTKTYIFPIFLDSQESSLNNAYAYKQIRYDLHQSLELRNRIMLINFLEIYAIQSICKPAEQIDKQRHAKHQHTNRGFDPHPLFVPLVGSHHHDRKKCQSGIDNQSVLGMILGNQHADAMPEEGQH